MFQFLLSRACIEQRSLFLTREGAGRCTRCWEWTQLGQLIPTDQKDVSYHSTRGGSGDVGSDGVCFPKSELHMMKPRFPGES